MRTRFPGHRARAALAVLFWMFAGLASAGPQRVFVASYGVDTNPCTRAQPCRTFAAAVTAVADGGEVLVLDSAGYGSVQIRRPLSIVAPPNVVAWINSTSDYGIFISLQGQVAIRGLRVASATADAIHIESGWARIVDCVASSQSGAALYGGAIATDSTFSDSAYGMKIGGTLERVNVVSNANDGVIALGDLSLSGVTVAGNGGNGLSAAGFSLTTVTVAHSTIANNGGDGVHLTADDGGGEVFAYVGFGITGSVVFGNGGYGVKSMSHGGLAALGATLSGNLIADNGAPGVSHATGAGILTANTLSHNGVAGFEGYMHTRGNNAILQTVPVSGTLDPVPGY